MKRPAAKPSPGTSCRTRGLCSHSHSGEARTPSSRASPVRARASASSRRHAGSRGADQQHRRTAGRDMGRLTVEHPASAGAERQRTRVNSTGSRVRPRHSVSPSAPSNHADRSEHALIETWSGAAWHAREAPAVRGTTSSGLSGVSCLSASDCVAVGDYFVGGRASEGLGYALILHWNGSSWALRPESANTRVTAMAGRSDCRACRGLAGSCLAVGTANPQGNGDSAQIAVAISPRTLSFTRAGLPALPTLPPYSPEGFFNAVSCESARDCAAVGALYFDRGHSHGEAFAATWNGHRWTRQSIAGADAATLTGVSCSSSGCVSVGYRGKPQRRARRSLTAQAERGSARADRRVIWRFPPIRTAGGQVQAKLRLAALEFLHERGVGDAQAVRDRHLGAPPELALGQARIEAAVRELTGA